MGRSNKKINKAREQSKHQKRIMAMKLACDRLGITSNNSVAIARKILALQGRQLENSRQHYIDSVIGAFVNINISIAEPRKKVTKKTKKRRRKIETFYDTREWREVRYEALKLYGRQCACCGGMPPDVVLHVDHIKPRSLHPELELDINNLQILCKDCNLGKSNKDSIDYRKR